MLPSGVAAGHPATVAAGIEILEEGGSAADAAVAACLASCVAETVMTGFLGGGHAIHWDGNEAWLLDCFVDVPSGDGAPPVALQVPFGEELVHYAVGPGTCAVPGLPARPRRALASLRPSAVAAARRTGAPARAQRRDDASRPRRLPRDARAGLHDERRRRADLRAGGASARGRRRARPAGPRHCARARRRRRRGQHATAARSPRPCSASKGSAWLAPTSSATRRAGSRPSSFRMRGRGS